METARSMADPWAAAWFSMSGTVVSGRQVPVGVLSTYMYPSSKTPLELIVHFSQAYPDSACPFTAASRSRQHLIFNPRHMYFNSLKEALFIQTGTSPPSSAG
jgi:Autophagy protein Apg5